MTKPHVDDIRPAGEHRVHARVTLEDGHVEQVEVATLSEAGLHHLAVEKALEQRDKREREQAQTTVVQDGSATFTVTTP